MAGSHLYSLVLTDIASGWTESASLLVREQTVITRTLDKLRAKLPVELLGLDVDNDSAFINETLMSYCRDQGIELTRCRAYKKNDQAWIEQKNGAVVRRLVGYGRLEGAQSAMVLATLHEAARLHVNFFQPSFKLKSKSREGAKVTKKYHPPATPYERLMGSDRITRSQKEALHQSFGSLDPVKLLNEIRQGQSQLAELEVGKTGQPSPRNAELSRFVGSLSEVWLEGEVRPTHRKAAPTARSWRTHIDAFEKVWPIVEQWLVEEPQATAMELFERLHNQGMGTFEPGQLRTLQRRIKCWRAQVAHRLILNKVAPEMEPRVIVEANPLTPPPESAMAAA
jgi:hypothetical protein